MVHLNAVIILKTRQEDSNTECFFCKPAIVANEIIVSY